jgi:CRP-like cAMP-binding protein
MNNVLKALEGPHPLSETLKEHLSKVIKEKKLARGEHLLLKGQTCEFMSFVETGLLRCYSVKDDKQICTWFMREGDLTTSVESFYGQIPSQESVQAIEPTHVYYITYKELEYIYNHFMEFNYNGRILTQHYYRLSEQRSFSIRMQTAEERYQYLLNNHPELVKRVPNKYLASYLGMDPSTLSRAKRIIFANVRNK